MGILKINTVGTRSMVEQVVNASGEERWKETKDRKMEGKKGETSPVTVHVSHVMGVSLWLHPIISLGTRSSRRCVSSPDHLHRHIWRQDQHSNARGKYSMNTL